MNDHRVKAMFEEIAFSYDLQNSVLSLRRDVAWRKVLAEMIAAPAGGVVLDVAVGTAEVAQEICRRRPGLSVLGVDFSPAMLRVGHKKIAARGLSGRIALTQGDARALPVRSGSVDAVTISFGIRNIAERVAVLREFVRVLKPGGQVMVMEFGYPRNPVLHRLYRLYFDHVLPPVGNWLSRTDYAYSYLVESVDAFPTEPAFLAEMAEAGLFECAVRDLTFGIAKIYHGRKAG